MCGVIVAVLYTCLRRVLRDSWGAVTNADAAVHAKTRGDSAMTIVMVLIGATMAVARNGLSCFFGNPGLDLEGVDPLMEVLHGRDGHGSVLIRSGL